MRLGPNQRDEEDRYPPFVTTAAKRERWDLAVGIATELFGDVGPDHVWTATRSIYRGPIPTRTFDDQTRDK